MMVDVGSPTISITPSKCIAAGAKALTSTEDVKTMRSRRFPLTAPGPRPVTASRYIG